MSFQGVGSVGVVFGTLEWEVSWFLQPGQQSCASSPHDLECFVNGGSLI